MINLDYLRTKDIKTGNNGSVAKYVHSLFEDASSYYKNYHKNWYVYDRFVNGDHWVAYNNTLNKIQTIPVSSGETRRTVNKIRSQVRGVKNFIKRSQPRWKVAPANASDEAQKEAEAKNKILQNIYDTKGLRKKLTKVIVNGLKYSAGILEGGILRDSEGKEYIDFWVDSTYDILFDPVATSVQDCRFIIKSFPKPVEQVKNDKRYKVDDLDGIADNKKAASEYKEMLLNSKTKSEGASKDLETTIVREFWYKYQKDGRTVVRVLTIIGNNVARDYITPYKRYPFFVFNPEDISEGIYSESWIKDLITLNKSLDKTVSQIESYIQRMLAGKYLIKQGVQVSTITDKGAEKIYYKGQIPPKQMDLPPLPASPQIFTGNVERWIEELGGVRDASLGRSSGSLQSGKGIEALQAADVGTVAEPIENLEEFLAEIGRFVLELISTNVVTSEIVTVENEDVKYIGARARLQPYDTVVVSGNENVKVEIVPEISYNEEVKRDLIFKLAESGFIDNKTLLEYLRLSNVGDIIARVEQNQSEKFKEEIVKQRESHRSDGDAPEDSADMANQENMNMAAGTPVPLTPKALWTPEHLELHKIFIKENQDAYMQNQELFDEHIAAEEQML